MTFLQAIDGFIARQADRTDARYGSFVGGLVAGWWLANIVAIPLIAAFLIGRWSA